MVNVSNLFENPNITVKQQLGPFTVLEYDKDLSVTIDHAAAEYYASKMNVHRRQVICELSKAPIRTQAGAMQWMLSNVEMTSGVKGVGGLIGGALKGKVTGESAVKPEYTGDGLLALEPTYKFILLEDLESWGGSIIIEDGMFLACDNRIKGELVSRSNMSSALGGGEGLFNLGLSGKGVVCLESKYPREELMEVTLQDDQIKIDGPLAVCWSKSLKFTVERSAKTLAGSALSGEGLVNVYRGTGKILMAPVG